MSEVISFRLNIDNPRERMSLEILKARCIEGYCVRQVITEALLNLNEANNERTVITLEELKSALAQVNQLLEQLSNGDSPQIIKSDKRSEKSGLADHFIASIQNSAKKGGRIKTDR